MKDFEKMDKYRTSRAYSCDAKYHAHSITLALECYYWTADKFHYDEAMKHLDELVNEMKNMKMSYEKEAHNG